MAFSFAKNRPSPIALDFGADSLKALQIVPGQPPQLIAAGSVTIPGEARQNPTKRKAFLGSAIQRLLKDQSFKGRRAICSVPAFRTLVQHVAVPASEGADINNMVGLHLMERLGVDPNRMVIRTYHLGQRKRDGQTYHEVACLAVSRETVMNHIRIAEQARLEVVGMHSEPPVILKAFESMFNRRSEDHKSVTCYIDIGAASTKVIVADGFKLVFAKRIDAGGDQVIEALAEAKKLSFDDARSRRITMQEGGCAASGQAAQTSTDPTLGNRTILEGQTTTANLDLGEAALPPSDQSPTGRERRISGNTTRRTGVAALDAMMVGDSEGDEADPGVAHAATEATNDALPKMEQGPDVLTNGPHGYAQTDVQSEPTGGGESMTVTAPATPTAGPTLADEPKLESEMLDCLIDELRLCLNHYQAHRPDKPVDRLVFLGGESKHADACRHIARSVRIPAQLGDPFARLRASLDQGLASGVDLSQPQPGWAVPFGLCFSEANL